MQATASGVRRNAQCTSTPKPYSLQKGGQTGAQTVLARIARGQTHRLTSGVTFPHQGAEQRILHFSPLERGRDPGSQTICLPPGYPGKLQESHASFRITSSPPRLVNIRLQGKGNSKLAWRKTGQPSHLVDVVDSDQQVVNKELSRFGSHQAPR